MFDLNEKEYFLLMELLKEHSLEICLFIDEMTEDEKKQLKSVYSYKNERLNIVKQLEDKFISNIACISFK